MKKTTKITVALLAVMLVLVAALGTVWFLNKPKTTAGQKEITFSVTFKDATTTTYEIKTEEVYLANALVNEGIVTYEPGGMYTTFCGQTADYNVDGGWWCINENGQMSMLGLNDIAIINGGKYEAVYTTTFES